MSKLLDLYTNLKHNDADTIFLFKSGSFYIALENDAKFLSEKFNLKLTNLNSSTVKCGFPCSSFDKYYLKFNENNINFKIIDNSVSYTPENYIQNKKISDLLSEISQFDILNTSVSEAFSFIEKIQKISIDLLGDSN